MRFQASTLAVLGLSAVLSHAPSVWKLPNSDEAAEVEKLDRDLSAAGVRGDLDATRRSSDATFRAALLVADVVFLGVRRSGRLSLCGVPGMSRSFDPQNSACVRGVSEVSSAVLFATVRCLVGKLDGEVGLRTAELGTKITLLVLVID